MLSSAFNHERGFCADWIDNGVFHKFKCYLNINAMHGVLGNANMKTEDKNIAEIMPYFDHKK